MANKDCDSQRQAIQPTDTSTYNQKSQLMGMQRLRKIVMGLGMLLQNWRLNTKGKASKDRKETVASHHSLIHKQNEATAMQPKHHGSCFIGGRWAHQTQIQMGMRLGLMGQKGDKDHSKPQLVLH